RVREFAAAGGELLVAAGDDIERVPRGHRLRRRDVQLQYVAAMRLDIERRPGIGAAGPGQPPAREPAGCEPAQPAGAETARARGADHRPRAAERAAGYFFRAAHVAQFGVAAPRIDAARGLGQAMRGPA